MIRVIHFALREVLTLRHGNMFVVVGEKINEEGEDRPLHNLQGRHMTLPFLLYS